MKPTKLPSEIFRYILEFLPLPCLLKSISLVCKEWYSHVWEHPPLWHTLEFVVQNKDKFHEQYKSFIRFCKRNPQKLKSVKRLIQTPLHENIESDDILNYLDSFASLTQFIWNI